MRLVSFITGKRGIALRIGLRAMSLTYFPLPTLSLVRRGKWIWTLGLGNFGLTYVNLKK